MIYSAELIEKLRQYPEYIRVMVLVNGRQYDIGSMTRGASGKDDVALIMIEGNKDDSNDRATEKI